MDDIWDDGEIREAFRRDFTALGDRAGGDIEIDDESTMFCSFQPTAHRLEMRLGVYFANGRQTLRFDTIREEVEMALVKKYEITDQRFVVSSEKGSRTFAFDVENGTWQISKEAL